MMTCAGHKVWGLSVHSVSRSNHRTIPWNKVPVTNNTKYIKCKHQSLNLKLIFHYFVHVVGDMNSEGLLCDFSAVVSCTLQATDQAKIAIQQQFGTLCS